MDDRDVERSENLLHTHNLVDLAGVSDVDLNGMRASLGIRCQRTFQVINDE